VRCRPGTFAKAVCVTIPGLQRIIPRLRASCCAAPGTRERACLPLVLSHPGHPSHPPPPAGIPHLSHPANVNPRVNTPVATLRQKAYPPPITDSGHAGAGDRETDRAPAWRNGEPTMPSLFFTCPKTRQQADTGIMTDVESLRDTWSMTLTVNCPHCGEIHAVSVRETYIDDAIRNVSETARRV
jgi:hypothetical protein